MSYSKAELLDQEHFRKARSAASAWRNRCREIISRYEDFVPLNTEDHTFVRNILNYHPEARQKIGSGVCRIWVQKNPPYSTRGFWVERTDGGKTDFSFYECMSGSTKLKRTKIAARFAIYPSILKFKSQAVYSVCPVLGIPIHSGNAHVDHCPPWTFNYLFNDFFDGMELGAIAITDRDGTIGCDFADIDFKNEWMGFHDQNAVLRMISAKANLSFKKLKTSQGEL